MLDYKHGKPKVVTSWKHWLTLFPDHSDEQKPQSEIVQIYNINLPWWQRLEATPDLSLSSDLLFLHLLHACWQPSCVWVTVAMEAVHLLPQSVELQAACCHLSLQQTALPLSHAHCFRVTDYCRFLHGKLHWLQPGFQAAKGLEYFNNLYRKESERLWKCMVCLMVWDLPALTFKWFSAK